MRISKEEMKKFLVTGQKLIYHKMGNPESSWTTVFYDIPNINVKIPFIEGTYYITGKDDILYKIYVYPPAVIPPTTTGGEFEVVYQYITIFPQVFERRLQEDFEIWKNSHCYPESGNDDGNCYYCQAHKKYKYGKIR